MNSPDPVSSGLGLVIPAQGDNCPSDRINKPNGVMLEFQGILETGRLLCTVDEVPEHGRSGAKV